MLYNYLYYCQCKSSGSRSRKQRLTAVGTSYADHVTPLYPQKLALTSPTGGGRSVGIVRSRTKATEFSLVSVKIYEVILMVTVNIIQTSSVLLIFVFFFLQEVAETTGKPRKMTIHLNTSHGSVRIFGKLRFRLVIKCALCHINKRPVMSTVPVAL